MKKFTFMKKFTLTVTLTFILAAAVFAQEPEVQMSVTKIEKEDAPTIDGNDIEDVWSLSTVTEESLDYFVKCEGDNCSPSADDLSGTFKTLWDTSAFYIYASITDDNLEALDQYTFQQSWKFDAIEVFINTYGKIEDRTLNHANDSAAGILQYRFNYGVTDPSPFTGANGYGVREYFERNNDVSPKVYDNLHGVEAAFVPSGTGFTMEIKLPWEDVFFATPDSIEGPGDEKILAFELHYADNDDGSDVETKATWKNDTGEEYWDNPLGWSLIELAASPTTAIRNFKESGFNAYPNPVSNQLYITGDEKIASYELYNILGASVQSENIGLSSFNIEMSNMTRGVYFIHLNTAAGDKLIHKIIKK
jgi:hypothetical protein